MKNSFRFSIAIGAAVTAVSLFGAAAQAICPPPATVTQGNGTVLVSPWRTLFPGICQAVGMASQGFGPATPRDQRAQIVAVDLQSSGLQFFTTPNIPDQAATIFDFLDAYPQVMLAINANFAWADVAGNSYLFGLAKSQGNLVSDPTALAAQGTPAQCTRQPDGGCQANVCDAAGTGTVALTITQGNQASFNILNAQSPTLPNGEGSPWPSVYTAVAGSPPPDRCGLPPMKFNPGEGGAQVLAGGVNNGNANDTFFAARTAVGLDPTGRFLFLLTIDGIEGADPPYGANLYDVGQWLIIAGASDGVNLDGGGSTAMAVKVQPKGGKSAKSLINVPHGDEVQSYLQRRNAQFLGVIPGTGP